jgi:anti-sigma regulatory factor (Ser/Thr protein kinase)
MKLALERHARHDAIVIPVILRPVDWSTAPFVRLKALPRDGKPLTTWLNRDEAFAEVARGIREIVSRFRSYRSHKLVDRPSLVDEIQRHPEWQRDIGGFDATIENTHPEHASLLAGITATKLNNLEYPDECIQAFRTSFVKLTNNALHYGCERDQGINVRLEISSTYTSVTVTNADGYEFHLADTIERCRANLAENPQIYRGRGLLMVEHLADSLEQIRRRSVKTVFFRDRVALERINFREIAIFRLNGGIFNPSLSRRILATISKELEEHDVVLDISEFLSANLVGSDFITVGLKLREFGSTKAHKFMSSRMIGTLLSLYRVR